MGHSHVFYAFVLTSLSLTAVTTLLHFFGIPTVIGFILTGVMIGPYGLKWVDSLPMAEMISELGIVFLMFTLGLEVSLKHLKELLKPLVSFGASQVFLTLAAGFGLFYVLLGLSFSQSLVFGGCLSLSSTAVVLKLIQERREMETPYGRASLVILLFQDLIALPLMAMIPLLAMLSESSGPLDWSNSGGRLANLVGFGFTIYLSGRYLLPWIFKQVARTNTRELFFLCVLATTLIFGIAAEQVGLSMSLGAFVAGVLISESPYHQQALAELSPLRDLFLGFFFASVGMMLDHGLIMSEFSLLIWLIPVLFSVKSIILYGLARMNRQSRGVSWVVALGLAQIGEFSLVLGTAAKAAGILDQRLFQIFLFCAVYSLLLTPYFYLLGIKMLNLLQARSIKNQNASESLENEGEPIPERRAIVIGLGHAGQSVIEALNRDKIPVIGIDFNLVNIERLRSCGVEAVYGDATRPEVLNSVHLHKAFLVVIAVNSKIIAAQILNTVRRIHPNAKVVVRIQYRLDQAEVPVEGEDRVVIAEDLAAIEILRQVRQLYDLEPSSAVSQ